MDGKSQIRCFLATVSSFCSHIISYHHTNFTALSFSSPRPFITYQQTHLFVLFLLHVTIFVAALSPPLLLLLLVLSLVDLVTFPGLLLSLAVTTAAATQVF